MSDVIITYENLYEILRREKYRSELQEVNPAFFKNVVNYLGEKTTILESQSKKDSVFASTELVKTQTQLKNVQKILKELYEKRENKILQSALFGSRAKTPQDTSFMLPEELALYTDINNTLNLYRDSVLGNLLHNKLPGIGAVQKQQKALKIEEKTNTLIVQILEDVPEFVGPDLNIYGPFKKDQKTELPEKIANLLVQTKQAENEVTQETKTLL